MPSVSNIIISKEYGTGAGQGRAGQDRVGRGQGKARQGKEGQGRARQDMAWQGRTRQSRAGQCVGRAGHDTSTYPDSGCL